MLGTLQRSAALGGQSGWVLECTLHRSDRVMCEGVVCEGVVCEGVCGSGWCVKSGGAFGGRVGAGGVWERGPKGGRVLHQAQRWHVIALLQGLALKQCSTGRTEYVGGW